jgi:hypothetical protein
MAYLRTSDMALKTWPDEEKGDLGCFEVRSKIVRIYYVIRQGQTTDSMSGGQIQHSHYDEKVAEKPRIVVRNRDPYFGRFGPVKYGHFSGSFWTKYMEEWDPGSRYDPQILVTDLVHTSDWH